MEILPNLKVSLRLNFENSTEAGLFLHGMYGILEDASTHKSRCTMHSNYICATSTYMAIVLTIMSSVVFVGAVSFY